MSAAVLLTLLSLPVEILVDGKIVGQVYANISRVLPTNGANHGFKLGCDPEERTAQASDGLPFPPRTNTLCIKGLSAGKHKVRAGGITGGGRFHNGTGAKVTPCGLPRFVVIKADEQ